MSPTPREPPRTPTQRMVQILGMLAAAEPDRVLQSSQLWAAIPEYDEGRPSGRRLYRLDIASLSARGLIRSGQQTRTIGNREAVKLRFVAKLEDFHLNGREHTALRQARRLLGELGQVPVTTGPRARGGAALDLLTAAVRVLEEHGDEMTLAELAEELQQDARMVLAALEQGWMLDTDDGSPPVLGDLDILYGDDEDDDAPWDTDSTGNGGRVLDPKHVRVSVLRPVRRKDTLKHTGLAALGRFAYTPAETRERLTLIERALTERPTEVDVDALQEAGRKLRRWAEHLQAHDE